MGFVAWFDSDPVVAPADDGVTTLRPDAVELERHVEIVRSSREGLVTVLPAGDDEPEPPQAA